MGDIQEVNQASESGEQEKNYAFSEVNFGHWRQDYDRDQWLTYQFARTLELVNPRPEYHFYPNIDKDLLKKTNALNIEGFQPEFAQGSKNNFTNDIKTDNPAAFTFLSRYNREVDSLTPDIRDKIKYLKNWVKISERGIQIDRKQAGNNTPFSADDLSDLTPLFYAIKFAAENDHQRSDKVRAVVEDTNMLFDTLMSPTRTSSLRDFGRYPELLKNYNENLDEQKTRVRNHLLVQDEKGQRLNSEYIRTTKTGMEGADVQLTYVDVSGLGSQSGTFKIAADIVSQMAGVNSDIIMLVDNQTDDNGEPLGKAFKIKIDKRKKDEFEAKGYDLRKLGRRLTKSEQLFGKGFILTENTDFNGHDQIIGSPLKGSALHPEDVYIALQTYFSVPRYEGDELQPVASEIAIAIGDEGRHYLPTEVPPEDPTKLTENGIHFSLRKEDTDGIVVVPVTLVESELPLYQQVFHEKSPEACMEILLAKTELTEHELISQAREERAQNELTKYITESNAPMVLETLNQLNETSISNLSGEQLLTILEMISQDTTAIDEVWNKDNLRFRILGINLQDWIQTDVEKYKAARYDLQTLPYKIDKNLTRRTHEFVAQGKDKQQQQIYMDAMTKILLSPAYIDSHTDKKSYDTQLQSMLNILSDNRLDETARRELAQILIQNYGVTMSDHWKRVIVEDPGEFLDAITALHGFPEQELFKSLIRDLGLDENNLHKSIKGIPESIILEPNNEAVKRHLDEQKAQGITPTMSLLVQIGREIRPILDKKGIIRTENNESGEHFVEHINQFDGSIIIDGLLQLQSSQREYDASDDPRVALETLKQIIALSKIDATAEIRLIKGAFVDALSDNLMLRLMFLKDRMPEIFERITFCYFNMQTQEFYDRKLNDVVASLQKETDDILQ